MRILKQWKIRIAVFLAVIGPGFITANVDNDAGGIYTYSLAGARYGYSLLWTLLPVGLVLIVVQEMSTRLGAVTGKGLADLHSRGIWVSHHLLCHGCPDPYEPRQRDG